MRALVQRVSQGAVSIDGKTKATIGMGYVILVGVGKGDNEADVAYLVRKTANLRVFPDEAGKLNRSLIDIGGEALVISQFTLYAVTSRGNRPGFEPAADSETAARLYTLFATGLAEAGIKVETGTFQAHMLVNILNDGPVTILLESPAKGENHG
jgi:D-tyrosyl-tRNA(Tyr) deacylase